MNFRFTVVIFSILAISNYVESKPSEAKPDVSIKSDSANSENPAPPYNEKRLPNDVPTTSLPVGNAIQVSDTTLAPGLKQNSSATTPISTSTAVASTTINSSTNATTKSTSGTVTTTQSSSAVTTQITTITTPTTSTIPSKTDTTQLPTSTSLKPSITSPTPISETSTQSIPIKDRRFDGPSFIGGIVLSLGTMAIGFVAFKFYKARTERNYHTL